MSTFVSKLDPSVSASFETVLAAYREQAHTLADAGVGILIPEMLVRIRDAKAAVKASSETGLPIWVGYTLQRSNGSLYLGIRGQHAFEGIGEALDAVADMDVSAFFIMHTSVQNTLAGLKTLKQCTAIPIGAYAHSTKIRTNKHGSEAMVDLTITATEYLTYAQDWVKMGAQIIGGCCGITPNHIRALNDRLPYGRP